MPRNENKKHVGFATHITAGGMAGAMEALCCQPLDTIKVRMQLSRSGRAPGTKPRGFVATGAMIVRRETPLALYKGLGAVLSGIVPKMAIRFASFETYQSWLADKATGKTSVGNIFIGRSYQAFNAAMHHQYFPSWSCCGNNGSGRGGVSNGSGENPPSGTATFAGRSHGNAAVSQCSSCSLYHCPRGRCDDVV